MSVPTQNGREVVWGTTAIKTAAHIITTSGIVISASPEAQAKETELVDEDDQFCTQIISQEKRLLTLEVLCESTTTEPAVGDVIVGTLTIFGITGGMVCVRPGVKEDWKNDQAKKLSVPIVHYPYAAV